MYIPSEITADQCLQMREKLNCSMHAAKQILEYEALRTYLSQATSIDELKLVMQDVLDAVYCP